MTGAPGNAPVGDAPRPGWIATLIVCALPAANLLVFGPYTVYAHNAAEFSQPFASFAPMLVAAALAAALLGTGLIRALRSALGDRLVTLAFALGALTWIQGGWLLANYGLLDGSPLILTSVIGGAGWESVLWAGILIATQICHRRGLRHWPFLSGVLIAVQLAGMAGVDLGSADASPDRTGPRIDANSQADVLDASMLGFSSDRNVILLIHDTFTTDLFLATQASDPSAFDAAWDGFVVYADTLGLYPTTEPSVATMFGLPAFDNRVPVQVYQDRIWRSESILDVAIRDGVPVDWIAPSPYFCRETETTSCFGMPLVYAPPAVIRRDQALQLVDVSLFRQVPLPLKPAVYRDGRWLVGALFTDDEVPAAKPVSSLAVFNEVIAGMHTDRSGTTLKVIHLAGGHPPLVLDGGCAVVERGDVTVLDTAHQLDCSLLQTRRFLQRLEELGLYDDALIVLMGDHGASVGAPEIPRHPLRPEALSRARTLLAIKWPGRRGPPTFSNAPVSLLDVGPTLAAALGLVTTLPGVDIATLTEDTRRSRALGLYTLRARADQVDGYLRRLERYACAGPSTDPSAWTFLEAVFPPRQRLGATRIEVGGGGEDVADHLSYHGWGPPAAAGTDRWRPALGRFASVYVSLPDDAVTVRAHVRGRGAVDLALDGQPLGAWMIGPEWTIQELRLEARRDPAGRPPISTLTFSPAAELDVDWIEFLPAG